MCSEVQASIKNYKVEIEMLNSEFNTFIILNFIISNL